MTRNDHDPDLPVYLTQQDLAARWSMSVRTLERWRAERYGPAWHVLGGSIRYSAIDVRAFEAAHRNNG